MGVRQVHDLSSHILSGQSINSVISYFLAQWFSQNPGIHSFAQHSNQIKILYPIARLSSHRILSSFASYFNLLRIGGTQPWEDKSKSVMRVLCTVVGEKAYLGTN